MVDYDAFGGGDGGDNSRHFDVELCTAWYKKIFVLRFGCAFLKIHN
jgi:hypothetical protein